jgi:hypothetical protein
MDLRQGLERELTSICREFQAGDVPHESAVQSYAADFERWRRATSHPDLISNAPNRLSLRKRIPAAGTPG